MKYAKYAAVAVAILGLVVGSHVFGAYTVEKKIFPYPTVLAQAFAAVDVYLKGPSAPNEKEKEEKSDGNKDGVTVNKPGAYRGYTFFSPDNIRGAKLVDMSGEVVHEWSIRFQDIWPDPPHVGADEAKTGAHWRSAKLLPDGGVLVVFAMPGATPYGYGLAKLDRESNVVWKYSRHVNHLVHVDDDGNVYALTHEFRDTADRPVPGNPQLGAQETTKILEDSIVKLSPDGEELRSFSMLEAIAESQLSAALETFPTEEDREIFGEANWDPLHPNNIEVVTPALAEKVSELEPGDVIVSFRTLDALVGFDFEEGEAVWMTRGFWRRQHDPDVLENGNILVFDNRGNAGPGGVSRIVEYDPENGACRTRYRGTKEEPFETLTSGSQQLLPNGNILITESNKFRILEVTPDGEIVWKYRTPHGHTHTAMRVRPDWVSDGE